MKKADINVLEPGRTATEADILLGQNIKKYRMVSGLSQTEVAKLLGVTFQQIQKYESGTNRVASSTLIRLSKILNIDYTLLLDPLANQMSSNSKKEQLLQKEQFEMIAKFSKIKDSKNREMILNLLSALTD